MNLLKVILDHSCYSVNKVVNLEAIQLFIIRLSIVWKVSMFLSIP